ncbi:MAG: AmmeMemoRadiSam system protein A [Desulfobacteraceae bacterium]|nr:MAG: AmmeMemoRadiSam system protein A [Desulfobacteraceae bacterium]
MQKSKPQLSDAQGRVLLKLARAALNEKFGITAASDPPGDLPTDVNDPALQACSGIFVTLKIGACLRGCIGSLVGGEPLFQGVRTYAKHAAFSDPRFKPLTQAELQKVRIEVSVLTPPRALSFDGADDLLAKLRPGVDGVTLRKDYCSATFLPQVWEQLPQPEDFLCQLCLKAGLAPDAWRTGQLGVETYQVQHFEE